MHRIDGPGAVNNLFTEGDPSVPQMATVVTAPWLNDVQENLARAIEAAGITPVKGDYDQLRQAVLLLSGSGEIGEGKIWFSETLPPSGDWMECDGSSLLIVDYPLLYAAIGNTWGAALAGYFKLPDIRGDFLRGWDHGRGRDPDAATRTGGDHVASTQTDQIKLHAHTLGGTNGGGTSGVRVDPQGWNNYNGGYNCYTEDTINTAAPTDGSANTYAMVPRGQETRSKNVAVMFIIRWR